MGNLKFKTLKVYMLEELIGTAPDKDPYIQVLIHPEKRLIILWPSDKSVFSALDVFLRHAVNLALSSFRSA